MDLRLILRILPDLLEGLKLTVALAGCSLLGAAIGGVAVMLARRSSLKLVRRMAIGFIEIMRNTPIMVQIFVIYFGLPSLGLYPDAFPSAVAALVLQNSAYIGKIYRAGIASVNRTQMEAALALGMLPRTALWAIVAPQALRRVMPALGNQAVIIIKDSSIASTNAVAELTNTGKLLLDRSAAPYETFLTVGLLYLALSLTTLLAMRLLARLLPVRA